MHYLITGGDGFIGTNLRGYLRQQGDTFTVVDKFQTTPFSISCDVTVKVPSLNCDKLIHLASETNVRESLSHPKRYITNNISGLINALDRAREDAIEDFVFTSSASAGLAESPYLASKAACESICTSYIKSYSMPIRVLKLSSIYGPHSVHKQSVVHQFIKCAIRKKPLTIFGDGNQLRDFVFVEDVCKAIVGDYSGYVTTGTLTTINELAERIADLSETLIGYRPSIVKVGTVCGEVRIGRTQINTLPCPKPLNEGLHETFNWYKDNFV